MKRRAGLYLRFELTDARRVRATMPRERIGQKAIVAYRLLA